MNVVLSLLLRHLKRVFAVKRYSRYIEVCPTQGEFGDFHQKLAIKPNNWCFIYLTVDRFL
jgi:hypothetical protein